MGKMNINRYNYESFFIDYIEAKLSNAQLLEFENFLVQNPCLAMELEAISVGNFSLQKEEIKLDRNILYSDEESISINMFTDRCIDFLENDFDENQRSFFLSELRMEDKNFDFELYQKTKLKKQKIIFPAKKSLYRYSIFHSNWVRAASIAAFFAVLFLLPLLRNKPVGLQVAQIPVVSFPEKNVSPNNHKLSDVSMLGKEISKHVVTHSDADSFGNKSIIQKKSKLVRLSIKENFKLTNSSNVKILVVSKFSKPLIRKDISRIKVLAYLKWSKSTFKKAIYSKNKFWMATKFVIRGVAKVTKRRIEIEDNLDPDGRLEYLVISTSKFKYERSFSARD